MLAFICSLICLFVHCPSVNAHILPYFSTDVFIFSYKIKVSHIIKKSSVGCTFQKYPEINFNV